jgi:acetyl-CoA synthetase (ADP-forming)
LIDKAKQEERHLLEPEALSLLKEAGIDVPNHGFVRSEGEALEAARSLGWPVVMKIVSPDILHKTDAGGVVLNVGDEEGVSQAFKKLSGLTKKGRRIEGVLVCPFQDHEVELSVGMVRDPQFGPVMSFGLGGVWIEVLGDVAYGIAPLSHEEAEDMLGSIRARSILEGRRSAKPADRKALCDLLVLLSRMSLEETAVREIDPMEKGYFIADARIIL